MEASPLWVRHSILRRHVSLAESSPDNEERLLCSKNFQQQACADMLRVLLGYSTHCPEWMPPPQQARQVGSWSAVMSQAGWSRAYGNLGALRVSVSGLRLKPLALRGLGVEESGAIGGSRDSCFESRHAGAHVPDSEP